MPAVRRKSSHEATVANVTLVPLDEIEEDPNQPRKRFPRDALEELAANIEDTANGSATPWVDGLLHPVVAYPSPAFSEESAGCRLRLLVGARRLRAYRHRGWPAIPLREVTSPGNVARTIMTQINENAGREATTLHEDARAVADAYAAWRAENPNGKQQEFATAFGRSKFWISRHLRVATATGIALQALEEGHLNHTEAYRLFVQLAVGEQSKLLRSARKGQSPISAGRVKAVARRLEKEAREPAEPPTEHSEAATQPRTTPSAEERKTKSESGKPSPPRELLRLTLSRDDLQQVLQALEAINLEENGKLLKALRAALNSA